MRDEIVKQTAAALALSMYAGEPCRVCGGMLSQNDIKDAVFAGYARENAARAAHRRCWRENIPKARWAYPDDQIIDNGTDT